MASVSAGPKAPRSNNTLMIGPAMITSATAAGMVSSSETSMARFWLAMAVAASPARNDRASMGSSAVPTATPTTPRGSWFTRSA